MDLFEQRDFVNSEIEKRAKHLFWIACNIDDELSEGDFSTIPYMSSCNGMSYNLNHWDDVELCHKFDDELGQWISKTTKRVNLMVSEHPDPYEDFGTTSWSIKIPYDLALDGDDESLKGYFKSELERKYQNHRNHTVTQLYFDMLRADKSVLIKLLDGGLTGDSSYQEKYDFLIECGVVKEINK